jgi:hypothetical protein
MRARRVCEPIPRRSERAAAPGRQGARRRLPSRVAADERRRWAGCGGPRSRRGIGSQALKALLPLLLLLLTGLAPKEGETFYSRKAEIAPFPREVPLNGTITFKITLKVGFHTPVICVTSPDGSTKYYTKPDRVVGTYKPEFDVGFKGLQGAYRVELVVDSDEGDTTAAQFTIWAGVERPESLPESAKPRPKSDYPPESAVEHPIHLERKLFRMINEYRKARGLEPFPWLEHAAILAREHWLDYMEIQPRPKRIPHVLPGAGCIADRFKDTFAWPATVRKFPIRDPEVGPEAQGFCSEALATVRSIDWLFRENYLRESAFRAPVISRFPTHSAVGIVRDEGSDKLHIATVYIQINSTRVLSELENEWKETEKLESRAIKKPEERAEFLRRLGRTGDPRSLDLFERRLNPKRPLPAAAALDALFLNAPEVAEKWLERQTPVLARAHREGAYFRAVPLILTMAAVQYDAPTRLRGQKELARVSALADRFLEAALRLVALGATDDAREDLGVIARRFAGLPAAEKAREKLREIEDG